MRLAHGVLASLAFIAIFPLGGILVRVTHLPHLAWVHGALQITGYAIFVSAAGIGIFMARGGSYLTEPHAVIGLLLRPATLEMLTMWPEPCSFITSTAASVT